MSLPRRRNTRSFVLVVVLGMMVLISLLVIGFLGHISSQSKSSTSYRDQTGTLLLGDEAVNLVKAQIDTATTASQSGNNALWASQPGAIRSMAYTNGTVVTSTYKLYSSTNLLETNTGVTLGTKIAADLPATTAAAASDWISSGLWTDLNGPVTKSDGTSAYPIIDVVNAATNLPTGTTASSPFDTGSFNVVAGNVLGATRSASGSYPLPMPVRWLYVLKQGQVIAPDPTSSDTALTFSNAGANKPTNANPIVGRIAFWTDDDTCRVNINTASAGTFWDTPRFTSPDDEGLSTNQPVGKEYQRYPGHVAMTTLGLALPELAGNPEAMIGLTPRYYTGGSTEGTVNSVDTTVALGATPKVNRLYGSVDELLFDPPPTTPGSARTASSYLSKAQLETAKFFLTAHSRAPELNLFGEPRVAIWPISSMTNSSTGSYRSATDQLIAFCSSTLGAGATNTYYFTRTPDTKGLNFATYATGLVGRNSSTNDVNLPRNPTLLSYLDTLTGQSLPGNLSGSATFDSKYQQLGMRQILTEIFDYIRITNARDPLLDYVTGIAYPPSNNVALNHIYGATNSATGSFNTQGDGGIWPTYYATWGTYGYGRLGGIVVEATMTFVGVGKGLPAGVTAYTYSSNYSAVQTNQALTTAYTGVAPIPAPATSPYIPPPQTTAVQAFFGLSFFDPAVGFGQAIPEYTAVVSGAGLSTLTLNNLPMNFPAGAYAIHTDNNPFYGGRPSNLGGIRPWPDYLANVQFTRKPYVNSYYTPGTYPFYSSIINITNTVPSATDPQMTLSHGGKITVNIYPLTASDTNTPPVTPLYTYVIDLASLAPTPVGAALPVPGYSTRPLVGSIRSPAADTIATNAPWPDRFDNRPNYNRTDSNGEIVENLVDSHNDTVISMVPTPAYGDYRMLAPYSLSIPSTDPIQSGTAFQPHPNFSSLSSTNRLAYGLEFPGGATGPKSSQGKLVSAATYFAGTGIAPGALSSIPMVPANVNGPTAGNVLGGAPPDFDNGIGDVPDGPYINKPDEGVIMSHTTTEKPYYDTLTLGTLITDMQNFTSPERQVPSPVMFGSLPTGAPVGTLPPKPWQTLLFQPGASNHPGSATPKDEYLLDLFWMPQSQPYAISEPFSTAGKVNLNYQIFPFTYIDRSTAIQSVLATEKVAMISASQGLGYKTGTTTTGAISPQAMTTPARFSLNLGEATGTLRQFAQKFANFDFFHAAAEICDVYLVPLGTTWTSDSTAQQAFYDVTSSGKFALVGDNTREKPYADIYSRITTKSNSFTVYYRVQTLKNQTTSPIQWTEGQGAILGDFRGSTTLERYIDPNDTTIPDYATNPTAANLETHYKWRIVENTRFAP